MSRRVNIVKALKNYLVDGGVVDAERVLITSGVDLRKAQQGKIVVFIMPVSDSASDESDSMYKGFGFVVCGLYHVDKSLTEEDGVTRKDDFVQLDEVWEPVQLRIESFGETQKSAELVGNMTVDASGEVFTGIEDNDNLVAAWCGFEISYIRNIGA